MTRYLLDTNVLSELRRSSPSQRVLNFISTSPLASLHISTITLAEIRFGIESVGDVSRRMELEHWLAGIIRPMFAGRVLSITEDVIVRWRFLVEHGRKAGRTFSQPDLFLAATALEYGLILVTRNTSDFQDTGVQLTDPWHE